jgi:hypothetical protein
MKDDNEYPPFKVEDDMVLMRYPNGSRNGPSYFYHPTRRLNPGETLDQFVESERKHMQAMFKAYRADRHKEGE